jgi:hypothetical protein
MRGVGGKPWPPRPPRPRHAAIPCRSNLHSWIHVRQRRRAAFIKETRMSIPSLSFAAAALPTSNIHPHGHRRGSHTESIGDSGSGSTTAVPAATQQNSFSSMLQSLEQAIGMRSSTTASAAGTASVAATGASSAAGAGTSANTLAAAAAAGTASASSVSTLLRNYLNNLSHTLPVDGSPTPKAGASNVSISV